MAGASAVPLEALWPSVRPQLPEAYRAEIRQALRASDRLWRIQLESGQVLALKLGAPDQPAANEAAILRWLERQACPTPRVLASGEGESDWLAMEWCGDTTLDDLAGTSPEWGEALSSAVLAVEAALRRLLPAGTEEAGPHGALRDQGRPWVEAAPEALAWLLERRLTAGERRLLTEVVALALGCRPAPGSLDYNARNVVIGGKQLRLIDFPAVGYDWTERRLAQYALGTRSGFASALTAEAIAAQAARAAGISGREPEDVARGVDAHEVLLLLIAARHLMTVETGEAHAERARAWADVAARKMQLRALLRRPLAEDSPANRLRLL